LFILGYGTFFEKKVLESKKLLGGGEKQIMCGRAV
jgi:hypothetical protein